jgi:L-lactate dehydrogenase complex protein LldG
VSGVARSAMLARIRAALDDVPAGEATVAEAAAPAPPRPGDSERFAERVEDYRATVTRCEAQSVALAVAELCRREGATRLACPAALPGAWAPPAVELIRDEPPLPTAELDAVDGVLTGAAAAIAETGTIVLDGGPYCGRRALTLVPDLHICVIAADQVVADVPDGLSAVAAEVREGRPITLISGPSATSDIELRRVEGVHGPRRLAVVLVVG